MFNLGFVLFGFIVGFIASLAVSKGETKTTMKTVSSFIVAVTPGAGTSALLKDTNIFPFYMVGLFIGFFIEQIKKIGFFFLEQFEIFEHDRYPTYQAEIEAIEKEWQDIDRFLTDLLRHQKSYITVTHIDALPYGPSAKRFVLKKYARIHSYEGITWGLPFLGFKSQLKKPKGWKG